MSDPRSSEDLLQKFAAGKLFRIVSTIQIWIHLCVYIASFVKLIMIEAGGYYNSTILLFGGITILSMPLFIINKWLIDRSLKISKQKRFIGYCFHLTSSIWTFFIVKISYYG
jgi:hypothetical protein